MLIDEMHHRFKLGLDRVDSQDRPDFLDNEVDDYLNQAINFWVKDRYGIDEKRYGFETNQERISNLMNLHIKSPIPQPALTPIAYSDGLYEFRLSSLLYRYLFLTSLRVKITKNNCIKTIDYMNHQIDDIKTTYSDASYEWGRVLVNFGKSSATPTTNNLIPSLYLDTTNKFGVQQFEIINVQVNYIKYPNRVCLGTYKHIDDTSPSLLTPITSCDIDDSFHDEIINISVNFAQRDIQDPTGYQLYNNQIKIDN
jgi:hypothetical protein